MSGELCTQRWADVSRRSESEICRSHTDNCPQLTAESYCAAENSAISSKLSLPKRIADHNRVRPAGTIVVVRKTAAKCGLHSQSTEEISANTDGTKVLRRSRAREIDARRDRGVSGH